MIKLKITGMTCQHCAETVKKAIEGIEDVKKQKFIFHKDMQKLKEMLILRRL